MIENASEWKVLAKGSNIVLVVRSAMASRNSEARSRPKVRSRIESGFWPCAIRDKAASTKTVVLPVPGPPCITNGDPRCVTALC